MVQQIRDPQFRQEVENFPGVVLLDIFTPTCGPCKAMAPWVDQLAQHYAGHIKVLKVDLTNSPTIASMLSVRAVPTFVIFENGKLIDRHVGSFPSPQALDQWVRKHFR